MLRDDAPLIAVIALLWDDALTEHSGLDLCRTSPPISVIVDLSATAFPRHRLSFAVQIYEASMATRFLNWGVRFDDHQGLRHRPAGEKPRTRTTHIQGG